MSDRLYLRSQSPEETRALAACLAEAWQPGGTGGVVQLRGELGAGKTVFVKGLAEGIGIDPLLVSSPTFVLANLYRGGDESRFLHHVDFYRLEVADELEEMGFYDLISPDALLAVEWGERFGSALPGDRLELEIVSLDEMGSGDRSLRVGAKGALARGWLDAWKSLLKDRGFSNLDA